MRKKKILAYSILLIGIACSAYLLFYKKNPKTADAQIIDSERSSTAFSEPFSASNGSIADPLYNITEEAAKAYTKQIISMNNGGSGDVANVSLPSSDDFETIIRSYLSQGVQYKEYAEKDLRISDDDSIAARTQYLKDVKKIQDNIIAPLKTSFVYSVAIFLNDKKSDEIQKHIDASSIYITQLLEVEVPKSAKKLHIDILNIYEKRRTLGTILLENSEDPLKSVVILQELEKLSEKEVDLGNSFKPILTQ